MDKILQKNRAISDDADADYIPKPPTRTDGKMVCETHQNPSILISLHHLFQPPHTIYKPTEIPNELKFFPANLELKYAI